MDGRTDDRGSLSYAGKEGLGNQKGVKLTPKLEKSLSDRTFKVLLPMNDGVLEKKALVSQLSDQAPKEIVLKFLKRSRERGRTKEFKKKGLLLIKAAKR
jgi:hypothetical protein